MVECFDGFVRITSKEFASTHPPECVFYKTKSSPFVFIKPYWREVLFFIVLLKVGLSFSLKLLILISSIDFVQLRLQNTNPLKDASLRITSSRFETTALAHVACAPQNSGVLMTEFAAACPSVNLYRSSLCSRTRACPIFSAASYEAFAGTASHTWNLREQNEDNS